MASSDDAQLDSITDTPVTDEMRNSFLEYAMSVIVSRALPDVRDGLKPVHRRILYAMWESGFRSDRQYRKCAATIGDTMRKYHPHGDSAIYDTLVRMTQPWALRVPLIDGHGNFGSLDDGPAAYRYTESRLDAAGEALLADVEEDTVDFVDNFDSTESEPTVLPAAFPNLLVNGSAGIAVGMATNIAPHNLREITEAAKVLLANPDATCEDLMEHVPGPDLPSGGQIIGLDGIRDAYMTGRGTFKMRATATIADVSARRKGIIVTELPYMVGPERIIAKIKEMVGAKRLEGIADVKDLSGRRHGLRLVIECKTGFNPAAVLEDLYRLTPLEESFGINSLALVDGQPRTLGLVDMLRYYLEHRLDVIRRRCRFRLRKAESRAHIIEGLLVALDAIDEVVATIRASRSTDTAKKSLIKKFKLSEVQATHILEMPLRRLTSLEVTKLRDEMRDLQATIADLRGILEDEGRQREVVGFELERACEAFETPRRTVLLDAAPTAGVPLEVPDDPCEIVLTAMGNLGRLEAGEAAKKSRTPNAGDIVVAAATSTNRGEVLAVTSAGRALRFTCVTVPDAAAAGKVSSPRGVPAAEIVALEDGETVIGFAPVTSDGIDSLVIATAGGTVKRLDPGGWPTRDGQTIIGLRDGDRVVSVTPATDGTGDIVFISDAGQLLRTPLDAIRAQGRSASGVTGMKLTDGASVLTAGLIPADAGDTAGDTAVVTVTAGAQQSSKRSAAGAYPSKGRGGAGVRCHTLRKGETGLAAAWIGVGQPMGVEAPGTAVPLSADTVRRDASGERIDGNVTVIGAHIASNS